jgi:predicted O-methyltransferase YrrM
VRGGKATRIQPDKDALIPPDRRAVLADLDGLISETVGLRLAELAASVPSEHAVVEIGAYKGKSTCYLAEGARIAGSVVVAVDPWKLPGNTPGRFHFTEARPAFEAQVERVGLGDWIVAVTAFSTVAASGWVRATGGRPIGLLYIDGSHLYADVRADFEAWFPHVANGGLIVFDDYDTPKNPGVKRFVDELRADDALRAPDSLQLWDFFTPPLAIVRKR